MRYFHAIFNNNFNKIQMNNNGSMDNNSSIQIIYKVDNGIFTEEARSTNGEFAEVVEKIFGENEKYLCIEVESGKEKVADIVSGKKQSMKEDEMKHLLLDVESNVKAVDTTEDYVLTWYDKEISDLKTGADLLQSSMECPQDLTIMYQVDGDNFVEKARSTDKNYEKIVDQMLLEDQKHLSIEIQVSESGKIENIISGQQRVVSENEMKEMLLDTGNNIKASNTTEERVLTWYDERIAQLSTPTENTGKTENVSGNIEQADVLEEKRDMLKKNMDFSEGGESLSKASQDSGKKKTNVDNKINEVVKKQDRSIFDLIESWGKLAWFIIVAALPSPKKMFKKIQDWFTPKKKGGENNLGSDISTKDEMPDQGKETVAKEAASKSMAANLEVEKDNLVEASVKDETPEQEKEVGEKIVTSSKDTMEKAIEILEARRDFLKKNMEIAKEKRLAVKEKNNDGVTKKEGRNVFNVIKNLVKKTGNFLSSEVRKESLMELRAKDIPTEGSQPEDTLQIITVEKKDGTITELKVERNSNLFLRQGELKAYAEDVASINGKFQIIETVKGEYPNVNKYLKNGIMTEEGRKEYQQAKIEFLKKCSPRTTYEITERKEEKTQPEKSPKKGKENKTRRQETKERIQTKQRQAAGEKKEGKRKGVRL